MVDLERKKIEVQPPTAEERRGWALEEKWRKKFLALIWKMEGQLKWERKNPREIAMSKRDIYRCLNGARDRKGFDLGWRFSVGYFQKVWVERNLRLFTEYLPAGTVSVEPGRTRAYLFAEKPNLPAEKRISIEDSCVITDDE